MGRCTTCRAYLDIAVEYCYSCGADADGKLHPAVRRRREWTVRGVWELVALAAVGFVCAGIGVFGLLLAVVGAEALGILVILGAFGLFCAVFMVAWVLRVAKAVEETQRHGSFWGWWRITAYPRPLRETWDLITGEQRLDEPGQTRSPDGAPARASR